MYWGIFLGFLLTSNYDMLFCKIFDDQDLAVSLQACSEVIRTNLHLGYIRTCLDISEVFYADSYSLGKIVGLYKESKSLEVEFTLTCNASVVTLLKQCSLDTIIDIIEV